MISSISKPSSAPPHHSATSRLTRSINLSKARLS
jgi:hypothetical protein